MLSEQPKGQLQNQLQRSEKDANKNEKLEKEKQIIKQMMYFMNLL